MIRDFLFIVVVVGIPLAGCTGADVPETGGPESETTDTRSSVRTSPLETTTSPAESQIEIPPCPNRSDSFTRNGVAEFAMQFEQARETRLTLGDMSKGFEENLTVLSVRTEDPNVTKTTDGWIVHFTVIGPYARWNTSDPEAPDHSDPALYTANYYITNDSIQRDVATEVVDPRKNGTVVECPPE